MKATLTSVSRHLPRLIGYSLFSYQHISSYVRRPCLGYGVGCLWLLLRKPKMSSITLNVTFELCPIVGYLRKFVCVKSSVSWWCTSVVLSLVTGGWRTLNAALMRMRESAWWGAQWCGDQRQVLVEAAKCVAGHCTLISIQLFIIYCCEHCESNVYPLTLYGPSSESST